MPDIDSLMQEWPPEVEVALQDQGLPPPDLDCSLESYIDMLCGESSFAIYMLCVCAAVINIYWYLIAGMLDIPVYESRVQSLHVIFSLHSAVKNSKYNPAL